MITPTSPSGAAITMAVIADKARRGARLTATEQSIVMSDTAQIYSSSFGPMPADMRLSPEPLPENVKGILTSFSL
ncbi:MAG: hypothetical protein FWG59_07225 [Betaproteobacteria bacterium]|nr:hypothetical protein [Betaproteobacteria bacterium]